MFAIDTELLIGATDTVESTAACERGRGPAPCVVEIEDDATLCSVIAGAAPAPMSFAVVPSTNAIDLPFLVSSAEDERNPGKLVVTQHRGAKAAARASAQIRGRFLGSLTFFKPVHSNMAHSNILGRPLDEFDLIVQRFCVLSFDTDPQTGNLAWVSLSASGSPLTWTLGETSYDALASSLSVWQNGGVAYEVSGTLWLGQ